MIERCGRLDGDQLAEVADLERLVVGHDGGRLKLEWGTLRGRSGERVEDLLARADGRLVGFAGLYQFGGGDIEIAGMVAPALRRRGLGRRLLDAAVGEVAGRGKRDAMLVVPNGSEGGRALADSRSASLDHRELRLVLAGEPTDGPTDPRVGLRPAETADADLVIELMAAGFGRSSASTSARTDQGERSLVVLLDGSPVGYVRLSLEDAVGGIYGFVVRPDVQGRGIGRDVLRRVCRLLRAQGATEVGLEVEVSNDRALGLYLSTGFAPVAGEEYWRLPVG